MQTHKQKVRDEAQLEAISRERKELDQVCSTLDQEVDSLVNDIEQLTLAERSDRCESCCDPPTP